MSAANWNPPPDRRSREQTALDRDHARQLIETGATPKEIAFSLGITRAITGRILSQLGWARVWISKPERDLVMRFRSFSPEERKKISISLTSPL